MMKKVTEVAKLFVVFTYYPNTVSYDTCTNIGSPVLYGVYEYTLEKINQKDKESLKSKHNETMRVIPVIFDENVYDVTVFDPTYAGYNWIPDLSIYEDYTNIKKIYISMGNPLIRLFIEEMENKKEYVLNKNLFVYSIMKIVPYIVQGSIYSKGTYCSLEIFVQNVKNIHQSVGLKDSFTNSYTFLQNLTNMTEFSTQNNAFFMMSNDLTHEPSLLQEPDYIKR